MAGGKENHKNAQPDRYPAVEAFSLRRASTLRRSCPVASAETTRAAWRRAEPRESHGGGHPVRGRLWFFGVRPASRTQTSGERVLRPDDQARQAIKAKIRDIIRHGGSPQAVKLTRNSDARRGASGSDGGVTSTSTESWDCTGTGNGRWISTQPCHWAPKFRGGGRQHGAVRQPSFGGSLHRSSQHHPQYSCNPGQIAGDHRQLEVLVHAFQATIYSLPKPSDRLSPAKVPFDPCTAPATARARTACLR